MSRKTVDPHILAINPGSSSIKALLFEVDGAAFRAVQTWKEEISGEGDYREKLGKIFGEAESHGDLNAIGCRVVHGGAELSESVVVTDEVFRKIKEAAELAPLHSQESIDTVEAARTVAPNVPIVAAFDTEFHRTLPKVAQTYAIPLGLGIKRYGFHGLAYRSVVRALKDRQALPKRLLACQLGSGSSGCAILEGASMDTTMGFTPLEGMAMGTRSGSIDPGILLYLLHHGFDRDTLGDLLNKKSGLLGLSGEASDVKRLEESAKQGDAKAGFALDVYAYCAAKQMASLVVGMGGVDGFAFSGGIGEHSSRLIAQIISHLDFLGLKLDPNATIHEGEVVDLSAHGSKPIWVVPASEEKEIAIDVAKLMGLS